MNRGTPALLAVSLTVLLSACSGGDGTTAAPAPSVSMSPSASPSASPSPSPSPSPVDVKAAGVAAAGKINLQTDDLPAGFRTSPASDAASAENAKAEKEIATCIGIPYVQPAVSEPSDDFVKGADFPTLQYGSKVDFYTEKAAVAADLAAVQGEKAAGCFAKQFKKELTAGAAGVTFTPVVTTRFTPVAAGSDGAFGLRFTSTGKVSGQSIPFTLDILGFVKDRTEVTLAVIAAGAKTNDAERDALFAKLVERGVANAL